MTMTKIDDAIDESVLRAAHLVMQRRLEDPPSDEDGYDLRDALASYLEGTSAWRRVVAERRAVRRRHPCLKSRTAGRFPVRGIPFGKDDHYGDG